MKVIVSGRQAGKTYALVQWVKEGEQTDSYPGWSRVILTHSILEAARLRADYDLDYRQVFSVAEWQKAHLGRKLVEIGVDNADLVLAAHIGQTPRQITITGHTD